MQRRHAHCQPARPTPVGRTARRQPCADLIHTLQSPAAFRHLWTAVCRCRQRRRRRRQEPVTARRRGQRGRGRRGRRDWPIVPLSKAVERPKMPVLSLRIIAMSGEMAANIIATAVGPNLAPVWLGHRLSSCGHSFLVAGPDLIGDSGSEAFLPPSDVQTGNACDPLRAGEAPKRVINTGMTVKTGRLTD